MTDFNNTIRDTIAAMKPGLTIEIVKTIYDQMPKADDIGVDQGTLVDLVMEKYPNEDYGDIISYADRVIEAAEPVIPVRESKPKYGEFDGLQLLIGTADGELAVDRNGVDVFTGKVYQLTDKQKQKFAEADKLNITKGMRVVMADAEFNVSSKREERKYDYDGLIVTGAYCLWLGARKAEKSLFALRKAMHDASGKNWLNHRNMRGPVKVLYFDAENDKADIGERYDEIVTEFSNREQELIKKNLRIKVGKELKRTGMSIEIDNRQLWEYLQAETKDYAVVYLDCWYQLQSINSADNQKQKAGLEVFERYFPGKTLFLLHHTRNESQESLLRKSPMGLRMIGAERWSTKSSGGNVLTKKAELIICQEKHVERDAEGIEGDWFVDFQAYSRSSPGTILFSFEPVFFEGERELKYRRKMVVKLSSLAAKAGNLIRNKGPWKSRRDLLDSIGMNGGKQYRAVDELIVKGFIVQEGDEFYVNDSGGGFAEAIEMSAENPVAIKSAGDLLDSLLLRPDGMPNDGVPYTMVKARAEQEGIELGSLRKTRTRRHVISEERGQEIWWVIRPKKS